MSKKELKIQFSNPDTVHGEESRSDEHMQRLYEVKVRGHTDHLLPSNAVPVGTV
ncbi:hypothetical protein BDZ89DRAFT_1077090 [Hymenopellis radicata]|nr:hypothetical protein BDZ89DRAFT_1077090 [Hymenopellis radicata]